MYSLRAHPFSAALAIAIIVALGGLLVIERDQLMQPNGKIASWGASDGAVDPSLMNPVEQPRSEGTIALNIDSGTTTPLYTPPPATSTPIQITKSVAADFAALLADLGRGISASLPTGTEATPLSGIVDAFSFIPDITLAPEAPAPRTGAQLALYTYGNAVGREMQRFESEHPDMVSILSAQAGDRASASKAAAVRELGASYKALGEKLRAISSVPQDAKTLHDTLATSYIELGTSLAAIPDATGDQPFIAAITAYNGKADAFTRAYLALGTFFSVSNVSFQDSDPGSVFSFSGN